MASRPPAFTRNDLEHMKRVDIQRLCKDYGLRANLKTEALIEMLLATALHISNAPSPANTQAPTPATTMATPASTPVQVCPQETSEQTQVAPRRTSSRLRNTGRTISLRSTSTKSRGASATSVIIHEDVHESSTQGVSQPAAHYKPNNVNGPLNAGPSTSSDPTNATVTRTRKAKDMQRQLGMGRPAVTPAINTRTVTRSSTVSRGKRSRFSRTVQPSEETILEEPEPSTSSQQLADHNQLEGHTGAVTTTSSNPNTVASTTLEDRLSRLEQVVNANASVQIGADSLGLILNEMRALHGLVQQQSRELQTLQADVRSQKVDIINLQAELLRPGGPDSRAPQTPVASNDAGDVPPASSVKTPMIRRTSQPLGSHNGNTPLRFSAYPPLDTPLVNATRTPVPAPQPPQTPITRSTPLMHTTPLTQQGILAPSSVALGKRRRDDSPANLAAVAEESQELTPGMARPERKRAKTSDGSTEQDQSQALEAAPQQQTIALSQLTPAGRNAVSVAPSPAPTQKTPAGNISGPPQAHLPEYFGASYVEGGQVHASQQQHEVEGGANGNKIDATTAFSHPFFNFGQTNALTTSTPIFEHGNSLGNADLFNFRDQLFSPGPAGDVSNRLPSYGLTSALAALEGRRSRTTSGSATASGSGDYLNPIMPGIPTMPILREDEAFSDLFGRELDDTTLGFYRRTTPIGDVLGASVRPEVAESPGKPLTNTLYGTELAKDTCFGDFGRDGIAGANDVNFWMTKLTR